MYAHSIVSTKLDISFFFMFSIVRTRFCSKKIKKTKAKVVIKFEHLKNILKRKYGDNFNGSDSVI